MFMFAVMHFAQTERLRKLFLFPMLETLFFIVIGSVDILCSKKYIAIKKSPTPRQCSANMLHLVASLLASFF